ncbi:MAG: hypothetical protein J6Q61_00590 [Bacteroidales bacterium]|nr:hypothetical protein [Bacteroidales bacterium]
MSTKNLTPLSPEFIKMLAQLGYVAVPKKAEDETEINVEKLLEETGLKSSENQMNAAPNTDTEKEIDVDELLGDLMNESYTPPNLRFKYAN